MGEWMLYPRFLDLGTSWRWVVSFTLLPLYPKKKRAPLYSLGRLGGPQSRSGKYGEAKILDHTRTRTPTPPSSDSSSSWRGDPNPKQTKVSERKKKVAFFSNGIRNQDLLCWRDQQQFNLPSDGTQFYFKEVRLIHSDTDIHTAKLYHKLPLNLLK
jgi:hypothetical protein